VFGDPHLYLAHGARADFRGRHGGVFNFLSTQNLSVNVRIANSSFYLRNPATGDATILVHGTMLDEAYIVGRTIHNHYFNLTYVANPLDVAMGAGGWVTASCSSNGGHAASATEPQAIEPHGRRECDNLLVTMSSSTMTLTAPDWRVAVKRQRVLDRVAGGARRLDMDIQLQSHEADLPTMPHGIIGQSWDGDGLAVDGQLDQYPRFQGAEFTTYAMAEGALEGQASDYEVSTPFEVRFKYSRFGTHGHVSRDTSALVKTCIATDNERVGASDVRTVIRRVACHGAHRSGDCVDTANALTGLQPRIARDCSTGLSQLVMMAPQLKRAALSLRDTCEETMSSFLDTLAPLGIPFIVPAGFTLNSTWSDVCPETCRTQGTIAACFSTSASVGKHFERVRRQLHSKTTA